MKGPFIWLDRIRFIQAGSGLATQAGSGLATLD